MSSLTSAFDEIPFDTHIDRVGTQCEKYDGRKRVFGRDDVLALWVADMDFAAPACVREALARRMQHPVFGYSFAANEVLDSLCGWFERRHRWRIDAAQLMLTAGVVPSLFACVNALTDEGDAILVPTPVYPPFFTAVTSNHRRLVQSPLLETDDGYCLNLEHLEREAKAGAKMLVLCNPHNPVGRVWRPDELRQLIDLALRYAMIVVSDDIHCDLVYAGHTYTPLATLAPPELRLITAVSPSKTFNIPGLNLSGLVVSHASDKAAIETVFARAYVNIHNPLSLTAFEAAYTHGDAWLDSLLNYLDGNRRWMHKALNHLDGVETQLPEATCLMWLNCRSLALNDTDLARFFIDQAQVGLNPGYSFGEGGESFMRLNFGTQRRVLEKAWAQLKAAMAQQP